jgi:hypothetical protein
MFKWCFTILWLLLSAAVTAQGETETNATTSGQLSPEFCSYNSINDKLVFQFAVQAGFSNDTNQRSFNIVENFIQYGGRVLLHYTISSRLKVAAGLGVWENPDVPEAAQYDFTEFRSFVQIKHYYRPKRITLTNRLRAEQRFVQNRENTAYDYRPRIRYSAKMVYAINSKIVRAKTTYAYGMGELFMTPAQDPFVKQVRLLAGLGYNFTQDVSVEIDYGYQFLYSANDPTFFNRILGITLNVNNILSH